MWSRKTPSETIAYDSTLTCWNWKFINILNDLSMCFLFQADTQYYSMYFERSLIPVDLQQRPQLNNNFLPFNNHNT